MARRGMFDIADVLLDEITDGSGGGGSTGSAGASGNNGSTGSVGATGSVSSGSSAQPKFEDDPRYKGTLADLQKERKTRQDYERRIAAHEASLAERQRQIEALTGTKTPSKEEQDQDVIRERLVSMFPALAKLTEAQVDKLLAVGERGEALEQTTHAYWTRHNKQMLGDVHSAIEKETGPLTDRQRRRINALYVAEAEANPDFLRRNDAGDPKLIAEFVKDYLEDTVEPIRRKVNAQESSRFRPVPGAKDRSLPMKGDKPIDVNDPKAVEDFLVESRRGKFGR